MTVPYSFGAATSAIPLSQLDANFNTPITLGNTAIQLGNTVTTLNNMTLANVTISSGNVTITNVTVTTANATTVNTTTLIATTANVTTGNVTNLISGNVSLTGGSITGTPISGSTGSFTTLTTSSTVTLNGGTANGVAYLNASNALTTGSALTFDGTTFGVSVAGAAVGRFAGGANTYFDVTDGTGNFRVQLLSNNPHIGSSTNNDVVFIQNNSEQMRLTSTGLGIGTSSPAYKLDVVGSSRIGGDSPYLYIQDTVNPASDVGVYFGAPSAATYAGILTNFASDQLLFRHNGATRMTLDSSGNLGLGVTPSAWSASYKALQIGNSGAIWSNATGNTEAAFTTNVYFDGSYRYKNTAAATNYTQFAGQHQWYTSASGTAGNAITFTQAMTLDASGRLLIGGTSSPSSSNIRLLAQSPNVSSDGGAQFAYNGGGGGGGAIFSATGSGLVFFGYTGVVGSETYTERARIDSSGNLGVGTTSPQATIVAAGSSATVYKAMILRNGNGTDGSSATIDFETSSGTQGSEAAMAGRIAGLRTGSGTSGALTFSTTNGGTLSERARITSGGNFYVGFTSGPTAAGSFYSTGTSVIAAIDGNAASADIIYAGYSDSTTTALGTLRFQVAANGNVTNSNGSYGTISDAKMKTDIVDASSQWSDIKALRFRKFKMKDDPSGLVQLGVVAQEVEQTSPGLVDEHADKDAEGNDLGTTTKSVKTSVLLMKAAVALQEAMARIEKLEAEVAALKGA